VLLAPLLTLPNEHIPPPGSRATPAEIRALDFGPLACPASYPCHQQARYKVSHTNATRRSARRLHLKPFQVLLHRHSHTATRNGTAQRTTKVESYSRQSHLLREIGHICRDREATNAARLDRHIMSPYLTVTYAVVVYHWHIVTRRAPHSGVAAVPPHPYTGCKPAHAACAWQS
jgi:hypothetical protein